MNALAPLYDKWHRKLFYRLWRKVKSPALYNQLLREGFDQAQITEGANVLEIACGPGRSFTVLEEYVGSQGSVTAIDNSQAMIAQARNLVKKHGWENVRLEKQEASSLKLDDKFDVGLIVLGLSVIPDWKKAFTKLLEHINPGGRVVIIDSVYPKPAFLRLLAKIIFWWVGAHNRPIVDYASTHLKDVSTTYHANATYFLLVGSVNYKS